MWLYGREGLSGVRVGGYRGYEFFKVDDVVVVGVSGGDEFGDVVEICMFDGGYCVECVLEFFGGDGIVVVGVEVIKRALDCGFRFMFWLCESGDDEFFLVNFVGVVEIDYFEDFFEFCRGVGGLEF